MNYPKIGLNRPRVIKHSVHGPPTVMCTFSETRIGAPTWASGQFTDNPTYLANRPGLGLLVPGLKVDGVIQVWGASGIIPVGKPFPTDSRWVGIWELNPPEASVIDSLSPVGLPATQIHVAGEAGVAGCVAGPAWCQ